MKKRRCDLKPFSKGWYRGCMDEWLESGFLQGISSASQYIYACEECEKIRMRNDAKRRVKEWKKKQKELNKDLSKTECFAYFKKLSITDPVKYDRILSMLGIEKGMSLYDILFGKKGE